MNTTDRPRSTRDRPAKAPLSEDAVVDAALAILRSEGLEAVSMRRVAAALDTGAASLYVYVANREGLLRAMHDRVTATITLEPADPARWRDQLHTLLDRMKRALIAHPGLAATAVADPPKTDATLRLLENLLATLLASGVDAQDAVWTADILAMVVTYAAIEHEVRRPSEQEMAEEFHRNFAGLAVDRFPLITAHATELVAGSSEERFRFAIDVVLDGMLARAGRR